MNVELKQPPNDQGAERGVLSAIIRHNFAFNDIAAVVSEADFYADAHQRIFRLAADLLTRGKPCDLVILFDAVRALGWQNDITPTYLGDLWELTPTAANATYHASIVREKAKARRLIHLCTEMIRDAYDGILPASELVASFESKIFEVAGDSTSADPVSLIKLMDVGVRELKERGEAAPERMIRSGLESLDTIIGGFRDGHLIILAARTSVGKSASVEQFAIHAAKNGSPVMAFSLEMTKEEWRDRAWSSGSQVPLNYLTGTSVMDEVHARRLYEGAPNSRVPVWIDDNYGHTVHTIAATARRAVQRHAVRMVVIDYLGLIRHERHKGDNLSTAIGNTTIALKGLAKQLRVPVILLAQLNRENEKESRTPRLSDLRESGNIEQDADLVIFLNPQPVAVGTSPAEQQIDFIVAKQRGGPKGVAESMYERATLTFREKNRIPY